MDEVMELNPGLFVLVLLAALLCQYLSISIGTGYGIIMAPLLLIMGFSALHVVPAILFSHLAGGIVGSVLHQRLGNIELGSRRTSETPENKKTGWIVSLLPQSVDARVVAILAGCGVIGVLLGAFTAINIPGTALGIYIGITVLVVGIMILFYRGRKRDFSWKGLTVLGLIGGFNKGISGGTFVVMATGGQIVAGREARSSLGSTTVAVTIVSAAGFLSYLLLGTDINWALLAAASIGSVVAAPFAVLTVKKMPAGRLELAVGLATTMLGIATLVKIIIA
ncbi:sulfite exporter TauE/SafE family protein [Chloroflexota bacterium]